LGLEIENQFIVVIILAIVEIKPNKLTMKAFLLNYKIFKYFLSNLKKKIVEI
jgi:hypothetical protein